MDLDHVTLVIRPRSAWEAMDLGCRVAVKWFGRLWRLWLVTGLPTGLIGCLIALKYPRLAVVLIWWLKPIHEPLLLYWLSRAVFGETLPVRPVAGKWRWILGPHLLRLITRDRFLPERSFLMPVRFLEGGTRETRRQRHRVLGKKQSGGLWLTGACLAVEGVICLSIILLALFLVPESMRMAVDYHSPFAFPLFYVAAYLAAVSIIAPFYVTGGFMLYISRRVDLEAWDLEIGFKKMADRAAAHRGDHAG